MDRETPRRPWHWGATAKGSQPWVLGWPLLLGMPSPQSLPPSPMSQTLQSSCLGCRCWDLQEWKICSLDLLVLIKTNLLVDKMRGNQTRASMYCL